MRGSRTASGLAAAVVIAAFLAAPAAARLDDGPTQDEKRATGQTPHLPAGGQAAASVRSSLLLGRSHGWRPIRAHRVGNPRSARRILVVGCIHGTECAGTKVTRMLAGLRQPVAVDFWIVHDLNPDGRARGVRQNGRGVDLNRNFDSEWRPHGRPWDAEYSGPRPFSEREARIARNLILRLRPELTIWYHQPQDVVRAWGPSVPAARLFATVARERFRAIRWPAGTAPNWQNHTFPGAAAFVVELPAGGLPDARANRHARAILALAQ